MKKVLLLLFLCLATATTVSAQMTAAMRFVGDGTYSMPMMGVTAATQSDTIVVSNGNADFTIPSISYNGMTIPSFCIKGLSFVMSGSYMTGDMAFTWSATDFTASATSEGDIKGTAFEAKYEHALNRLTVSVTYKYGRMPAAITYTNTAWYIKTVTGSADYNIGGLDYTASNVSYDIRRYIADGTEKVDVAVGAISMTGTPMGTLTIGGYTVEGLVMDEAKGGFYRNYVADGKQMYFKSVGNDGTVTFDNTFPLAAPGPQDITVVFKGSTIASIVNNFKPGNMPFQISSTYPSQQTGISNATFTPATDTAKKIWDGSRLIIEKNGKRYTANGTVQE